MYKYKFDPSKCLICGGKCCIGESGYIWISEDEIIKLADFLKISTKKLKDDFLYKEKYKFSIKEIPYNNGYACIFFDQVKKNCSIYEVRPNQCRTFPFWDYFKTNFKELKKECIGVYLD